MPVDLWHPSRDRPRLALVWNIRIRRNHFTTVPMGSDPQKFQVNQFLVAAKLADDSVISHHSALAYYGVAQSVRHTMLFTTKKKDIDAFDFQDDTYRSVLTKKALVVHDQENILVSTVDCQGLQIKVTANERTLVDCFQSDTLEKITYLLELLNLIAKDDFLQPRLPLKRGTALNLFHFNLPRLSVDIDLNYIRSTDGFRFLLTTARMDLTEIMMKLAHPV
ncbi:MAG: nucleotidyl transferase AbiEii/AbiGii toxin family protein [Cyanobacteria bacterium REEB67]|nr:nucleotidyl transferase AbiEii/AbiGii toxin family protein [Cyanobacteria bacterium REEB67]